MIIAMAGLPASGKSALGTSLQQSLGAVLLDKDRVRDFLFADRVDYSREQNDLCVNVLYDVAVYVLTRPDPPMVILDGRTYSRRYQVEAVQATARRADVPLRIIECICSEDSARQRLLADQGHHPAKDRDFAMYQRSRAEAEPIMAEKLVIDTDRHVPEECLELALQYLGDA